ncbi:hypothetical protein N5C12_18685 [Comamonas aquatica]|uniref:hypothetical protein n=1 Tax=Comamonas aquatica TaxID=225991 RepID=UPI00244A3E94|nr:hypothetical protein [Comamonas aquatica]MDH0901350.1 hypothetical protein [Comamonas aquatica]
MTWLKREAMARRAGSRVSTSKGRRARTGELLAAGPKQGMRAQKTDDFWDEKQKSCPIDRVYSSCLFSSWPWLKIPDFGDFFSRSSLVN